MIDLQEDGASRLIEAIQADGPIKQTEITVAKIGIGATDKSRVISDGKNRHGLTCASPFDSPCKYHRGKSIRFCDLCWRVGQREVVVQRLMIRSSDFQQQRVVHPPHADGWNSADTDRAGFGRPFDFQSCDVGDDIPQHISSDLVDTGHISPFATDQARNGLLQIDCGGQVSA